MIRSLLLLLTAALIKFSCAQELSRRISLIYVTINFHKRLISSPSLTTDRRLPGGITGARRVLAQTGLSG